MTGKERIRIGLTRAGFEVIETVYTLQWTMRNGQTNIDYFDEEGEWIKSEQR